MANVPYDPVEIAEVYIVTTISDGSAPTVTELNAGTRLTDFITDGPPSPAGSNFLDAGTLASGFQSQVASTYGGGSGTMTILKKRDSASAGSASADTAFAALPRGTVTNLVVAPYGTTGSSNNFAAGDVVCVYPIEVGNRADNLSRGSLATASIDIAFNDLPDINVAVTT